MLEEEEDEVEEVKKIGPHPDASTTLIFVNRPSNRMDVMAFKLVYFMFLFKTRTVSWRVGRNSNWIHQ